MQEHGEGISRGRENPYHRQSNLMVERVFWHLIAASTNSVAIADRKEARSNGPPELLILTNAWCCSLSRGGATNVIPGLIWALQFAVAFRLPLRE